MTQKNPGATKKDILGVFYRYPIKILPVVDNHGKFVGILNKDDLIASSSKVDDLKKPLKKVIFDHLIPVSNSRDIPILQNLLQNFLKINIIPVFNKEGKIVDWWEKFDVICQWEGFSLLEIMSQIFNYASFGVLIVNNEGRIAYHNQLLRKLLKIGRKKILGEQATKFIDIDTTKPLITSGQFIYFGEEFNYNTFMVNKTDNPKGRVYLIYKKQ